MKISDSIIINKLDSSVTYNCIKGILLIDTCPADIVISSAEPSAPVACTVSTV